MVLYKIVTILQKICQSKRSHTFSVSKKHFALVQCILVQCDVFTEQKLQSFEKSKVYRIGVPRNVEKFTKNSCVRVSFLTKLQASNFVKKEAPTKAFSCKFCEIFENSFFYRTPPTTACGFRSYKNQCFQNFTRLAPRWNYLKSDF